ncbi:uncharacterized protein K02A2.6-like [Teleopsis dalmanni]|uniref:uncharacterized protein K02A2.6-like n=1 Tax=Teleopsis dalmanni TaxID=139649 RepID=UPI0018CFC4A6|nr:uncharacterized protein K02A2.6-like [Teleopsis dalmanni]
MGYSSKHVITKLKSIYARHGIPKPFVSDNGPPYNSKEFNQFCNDWSIEHITSSSHFPRSNGMAEHYYTALLHYRTTPKGNLPSRSQLLMSRQLRTKLPTIDTNLEPKIVNNEKYKIQVEQNIKKMSENFNKKAVKLQPIFPGEEVMFKRTPL